MVLCLGWPWLAFAQPHTPQEQVAEAARQYLQSLAEAQDWQDPVFDIQVATRLSHDGACSRPLDIRPAETKQLSRMRFDVTCSGAGAWRETFVVRARVLAQVVVAAMPISARQPIRADDLRTEERDITAMPDALAHPEDAEAQTSRRALRPGQVVQKRFLQAELMVRRGAPVQIVARSGGVQVTHSGESLDNGSLGQTVRVRNSASGKVIDARVVDQGVVEPLNRVVTPHSPD